MGLRLKLELISLRDVSTSSISKSSSENGKYLHDDTKGRASKIYMDHSQNIQSSTCTVHLKM